MFILTSKRFFGILLLSVFVSVPVLSAEDAVGGGGEWSSA
jgi:hypothetical protein